MLFEKINFQTHAFLSQAPAKIRMARNIP